jgi:two-component system sensor histidine kinase FlrB
MQTQPTMPTMPTANPTTPDPLHGGPQQAPAPSMSPAELAAIIEAFNDVTSKLTRTHEQLQAEIVTLRSQLCDAQAQAERARHLALLGEMAAGIAHEVRNPLGSIRLYAKMLREDLREQPGPLSIAEKIDRSVLRLEHVVGDVLTFSRKIQASAVTFDASELLEAAAETARFDGPVWDAVQVEIKPTTSVLTGDPDMLRQALVNIIRNAAEAMAEHRAPQRRIELSVAARKVRDEAGAAKDMLAVCIADSGPGIPESVLPRLFEPFFTTRSDGTGLGLAIVHRIIDAHGGRITARNGNQPSNPSASGVGAVFEILLPASK